MPELVGESKLATYISTVRIVASIILGPRDHPSWCREETWSTWPQLWLPGLKQLRKLQQLLTVLGGRLALRVVCSRGVTLSLSPASAAATSAALAATTTATALVGLGELRQKLRLPLPLVHDASHDVPVLGLEDRSSSKLGGFGTWTSSTSSHDGKSESRRVGRNTAIR